MTDSMLIAPFKTGLEEDVQPWLAPPDSFTKLNNMHLEHGYLERRNGYQYFCKTQSLTNGTAVTGFGTFVETTTGVETMMAFDTTSAYKYNPGTETFTQLTNSATASPTIFSSSNNDYVQSANWQSTAISTVNRMYFTNGKIYASGAQTDGIWYFSGGTTVTNLQPAIGGGVFVWGSQLIFSLGQRLVLLYTYEGTTPGTSTRFPQRARWCGKQNPDPSATAGTGGWLDAVAGSGDYSDAATNDQIISAQILQNQIIVFFTNSVWALIPTGDPNKAFRWQKINNFRSCGGRMASIGYDRFIGAIGDRGITATDGLNTTRIDDRISDFTISKFEKEQFSNTFCARDFNNRRWWTLFTATDSTENDRVLIYDDETGSYSTYDLPLNALGYGVAGEDYEFQDFSVVNQKDWAFNDFDDDKTFDSYYFQKDSQFLVGGDKDGYIYQLDGNNSDNGSAFTASFLSVAWNPYKEKGQECVMPYIDLYVETSQDAIATINFYKDTIQVPYTSQNIDFLPDLDFVTSINSISLANPCSIKAYNHGLTTGDVIYIYLVSGMTEINSGNINVSYTVTVVDADNFTLDGVDSTAYTAYTKGGGIYLKQFYRTKTWKRAYGGGTGFQHRIGFESSGINTPFRIHAIKPWFKARGRRMAN